MQRLCLHGFPSRDPSGLCPVKLARWDSGHKAQVRLSSNLEPSLPWQSSSAREWQGQPLSPVLTTSGLVILALNPKPYTLYFYLQKLPQEPQALNLKADSDPGLDAKSIGPWPQARGRPPHKPTPLLLRITGHLVSSILVEEAEETTAGG